MFETYKNEIIGWIITIYGIIVLIGAAIACPAKHASISMAIFMILVGLAFISVNYHPSEKGGFQR